MKIIWITGGSSGIGLETAKKFLDNNWRVVISSSNSEKLLKAKNKILEINKNKNLHTYQFDISNREQVIDTV